jgi:hypothetical protein
MADRSPTSRAIRVKPAISATNDDISPSTDSKANLPQAGSAANDNRSNVNLPACLEVTDDEVRLLHRYLGRQILALFG